MLEKLDKFSRVTLQETLPSLILIAYLLALERVQTINMNALIIGIVVLYRKDL